MSLPILALSANTPADITEAAISHGFHTVIMPPMADMAAPVCSHPDMLFFYGFGRLFVRAAHMNVPAFSTVISHILSLRPDVTLTVTSDVPSAVYPDDVCFNCAVIGGVLTGAVKTMSAALKRTATENMLPIINSSQGYVKCSCCIIPDNTSPRRIGATRAVITADTSIAKLAVTRGVNVIKLNPGGISLPGYSDGFIGGASFYYDNTLYFLGDIAFHPNCDKIKEAADILGLDIVSLGDSPVFDSGCLLLD